MEFEDFRAKIESYLPIDFNNINNKEYINYLKEALILNAKNSKEQFSLIAANMLFMSIIYKYMFVLHREGEEITLASNLKPKIIDQASSLFHLSKYPEKEFVYSYMTTMMYHDNDIEDVQSIIMKRDHCAHASGKIHYDAKSSLRILDDLYSYVELTHVNYQLWLMPRIYDRVKLYFSKNQDVKPFFSTQIKYFYLSNEECKGLAEYISKQSCENDYNTQTQYCLLRYYLNRLSSEEDYTVSDEIFIEEIEGICLLYPDKKDEILEFVNIDLTTKDSLVDNISYDELIAKINSTVCPRASVEKIEQYIDNNDITISNFSDIPAVGGVS